MGRRTGAAPAAAVKKHVRQDTVHSPIWRVCPARDRAAAPIGDSERLHTGGGWHLSSILRETQLHLSSVAITGKAWFINHSDSNASCCVVYYSFGDVSKVSADHVELPF